MLFTKYQCIDAGFRFPKAVALCNKFSHVLTFCKNSQFIKEMYFFTKIKPTPELANVSQI